MVFLSNLVNGISLGSIYAIIALGYTMVYGIAKMLNFAHGDVIMVGAFIIFSAAQYWKLPPAVCILLAMRVSMQAMGQKAAPVLSSVIELVMKVTACIWLIPKYGFVGTCITEPVTWVLMTAFLMGVYLVKTRKLLEEEEPDPPAEAACS